MYMTVSQQKPTIGGAKEKDITLPTLSRIETCCTLVFIV